MRSMVEGYPTLPSPTTNARARQLRREMSLPEVLLWRLLRSKGVGFRFRRQHPMGPYILDFYCPELRLAVEVDGIGHDMGDRPERDKARRAWLAEQRIDIVSVPAAEVLKDVAAVADAIRRICHGRG
jgi:very-short-patch-repair endonuclease